MGCGVSGKTRGSRRYSVSPAGLLEIRGDVLTQVLEPVEQAGQVGGRQSERERAVLTLAMLAGQAPRSVDHLVERSPAELSLRQGHVSHRIDPAGGAFHPQETEPEQLLNGHVDPISRSRTSSRIAKWCQSPTTAATSRGS